MSDEFFIGWRGRAPAATARRLRRLVVFTTLAGLALAAALALSQGTLTDARWEYGEVRSFTGLLLAAPAPVLVLDRPEPGSGATVLALVDPLKFGFDPALAAAHDLKCVRLEATLLHRGGDAILEVVPGSVVGLTELCGAPPREDLGEAVLAGEIVDSKCFLGAMNPGVLKPHRACAIRCVSGGIPPSLLVRTRDGGQVVYLLVDEAGGPAGPAVLGHIAEPVELRGRVERLGGRLLFRADLASLRRL